MFGKSSKKKGTLGRNKTRDTEAALDTPLAGSNLEDA
jgi:hypothetical protein